MEEAFTPDIEYYRFDPHLLMKHHKDTILTKTQKVYFYVDSIEEATAKVREYCKHIRPDLNLTFNEYKHCIEENI